MKIFWYFLLLCQMEFTTELKDFQKEAVEWMIGMNKKYQGGFNFMEPGLGKSICCINTIKTDDTVLIVCPAGVMYNWVNEFKKHTNLKYKDILVYHGADRGRVECKNCKKETCNICKNFKQKLENKKIVITSYHIIARSFNKTQKNFVTNKKYSKIFFDEAHILRNKKGSMFHSCCLLKADCKWCVTATPIFNKYNEVYVYFKLIDYFENYKEWKEYIKDKTKIKTMRKINNLIKKLSIKKEKSKVLKTLLPKKNFEIIIKMSNFEREFYNCLKEYSITRMKILMNKYNNSKSTVETRMEAMQHFLVYILRLRQACDSPLLVIGKMDRLKRSGNIKTAIKILKFYNESKNIQEIECPICYDADANCIVSPCGHRYCEKCIDKIINLNKDCSICRKSIEDYDILNKNAEKNEELILEPSKKIKKTIELVIEKIEMNEKVVIVSQWLTTLTLIEDLLNKNKIKYTSLTGSMDIETRMSNINDFNKNTNIKVCLISMCASSEGINLTSANNMILIDHWWNKSRMIQVIDRIHRIGQEKQVNIYNLITVNTIEEKIKELVLSKERYSSLIIKEWEIEDDDNYDSSWMNNCIKLLS